MIYNEQWAFQLCTKLLAVSLLINSAEYLTLLPIFSNNGIWKKNVYDRDLAIFPLIIRIFYQLIFAEKTFRILIGLRFILSARLFFVPDLFTLSFLLISSIFILQRFRGSFNGGSDYMTILTLFSLTISSAFSRNPNILKAMLFYLSIQVVLSYFLAGLVKIKNIEWRSGHALLNLSRGTNYAIPNFFLGLFANQKISLSLGWIIILFEILFPTIFFIKNFLWVISFILTFHLFNFFIFGLNRFFWAWAATYPALIYALTNLPSTK